MAWTTSSHSYEFHNTKGQKFTCSGLLMGPGSAWKRVTERDAQKEVYEHIDPTQALLHKDHVVLHRTGKVHDDEVLELKRKADLWNSMTKWVSGFTREHLMIAELFYQSDPVLVGKLNLILEKNGLGKVTHVLYAIYRMSDTFRCAKKRELIEMSLNQLFKEIGTDEKTGKIIVHQWPTCWEWTKTRVNFAHPLLGADLEDLEDLKRQIQVKHEYDEVCEAVDLVMKSMTSKS